MPWVAPNKFLGMSNMKTNAAMIYKLKGASWSINALSAILGNMQSESTINPGIWESLKPYWRGYGLVQWTPYTKLTEWIMSTYGQSEEQALRNYEAQLVRIDYEADHGLQWFSNPKAPIKNPPITLSEFLQSDLPPGTLANYFLWFYEHPATTIQPQRAKNAAFWYEFLTGEIPPVNPSPFSKQPLPIYYYGRLL